MFASTPMQLLCQYVPTFSAIFDQCQFGLRPPAPGQNEFIRKSTCVLANFPEILDLERRCHGVTPRHKHVHALGRRRVTNDQGSSSVSVAFSAGRYPDDLCAAFARSVARAALRLGLTGVWQSHLMGASFAAAAAEGP